MIQGRGRGTVQDEAALQRCHADRVLGPVVDLARAVLDEGLQSDEAARLVGSAFYAAAAAETLELKAIAVRAAALLRALRHLGLVPADAAEVVADVFSRRIA